MHASKQQQRNDGNAASAGSSGMTVKDNQMFHKLSYHVPEKQYYDHNNESQDLSGISYLQQSIAVSREVEKLAKSVYRTISQGVGESEEQGSSKKEEFEIEIEKHEQKTRGGQDEKKIEFVTPSEEVTSKQSAAAEADVGQEISLLPVTTEEDPAFQKAKNQVYMEAKKQKIHSPHWLANQKRKEAEDASALSKEEQISQNSKEYNVKEMKSKAEEQQEVYEEDKFAEKFIKAFRARVDKEDPPTSRDEAKAFASNPSMKTFPEDFSENVSKEQGKIIEPMMEKVEDPSPKKDPQFEPKVVKGIPNPKYPPAPKLIDPKLAIPKPKIDQQISLQREGQRLDEAMQENSLSDEQLAESREPSFVQTFKVKQEAQQKVSEAISGYRHQENKGLQDAEIQAGKLLSTKFEGMSKVHRKTGAEIFDNQGNTSKLTKTRQFEIKETIERICKKTADAVNGIVEEMIKKVKKDFTDSLAEQQRLFNNAVSYHLEEYYGGWTTKAWRWLTGPDAPDIVVFPGGRTRPLTKLESLTGDVEKGGKRINRDVYAIFVAEKNQFSDRMDDELRKIAKSVKEGLNSAKNEIQCGIKAIDGFKGGLKGEERAYAETLVQDVKMKFKYLEGSIDHARDDLIQTLADEYKETNTQLETKFNEINDELKKSWIDRGLELIETVGKTIYQLGELLLSILGRMKDLVLDIVKHPIRFFETLVSGLKQGIGKFIDNIGTYLQEAFWTWITGQGTPVKNIRLSASSGIESLFNLVVQVLDLGPDKIHAIAEGVLGKELMQMVDRGIEFGEKALEPATILLHKGPLAFWHYIEDTIGGIIQSSFDRIKESVFYAFVEKGLKWIAGFFIPGGGFVKVVRAIFSAFQFVAENLENIRHFFDSIFDSMEAALQGNTEGVVSRVITGLSAGVVLALDFLAKQLGIDTIVNKVHNIIQAIRTPIVKAIEWVLRKAVQLVKATGKFLLGGKREKKEEKLQELAGKDKELENAKDAAHDAVMERIGSETTIEQAQIIIKEIKRELRSMGLKELVIGSEVNGERPILAEASPMTRIGALVAHRIIVGVSAKIRVAHTIRESILEGMKPEDELKFANIKGISAAQLPPVGGAGFTTKPRKTMAGEEQPSAGYILEPAKGSKELEVLAYNTRVPAGGFVYETKSNVSHAEHQFAEWIRDPRHVTPKWLDRVEEVHIDVEGQPICKWCWEDLRLVKEMLREKNPSLIFTVNELTPPSREEREHIYSSLFKVSHGGPSVIRRKHA